MKISIILVSLIVLNQSCNTKSQIDRNTQSFQDSLKYPLWHQLDDTCKQLTQGYFSCCNYKISNYYFIDNAITTDYDSDGDMDTITLVKPYHANLYTRTCFQNSELDTNFLFVCNVAQDKNSHTAVYHNIVSSKDPLLGEEHIEAGDKGIVIVGDFGHSNKFGSKVFINFRKGNFFIDSIRYTTLGNKNLDSTMRFDNNSLPLENYNKDIIDRLFEENM